MKRKIAIALGSLLLLLTTYAQNTATDSTAPCVAYWRKGEVKNLLIKKTSSTMDAGKEKRAGSTSFEATLTVLDSTEKNYTLEWKYKSTNLPQGFSELDRLNRLLMDVRIVYSVSETGAFDSLINYEEMKKFIEESITELSKISKDKEDFNKLMDQYVPMLKSRQGIESVLLREIQLYHAPYGVEYSTTEPQILETELPNIFGGDPFPAVVTLSLNKIDTKNDLATIVINQEVDKEKTMKIMNDFFARMAKSSNKPFKDEDKLTSMDLQDRCQYDLVLSDGWIKKMFSRRVIRIKDMNKTETCEITIK